MNRFLIILCFALTVYAGCHINHQKWWKIDVKQGTTLELHSSGMCSQIITDFKIIKTVESEPTWIAVKGYINGEYVTICNSTLCEGLNLASWSIQNDFMYRISSNQNLEVRYTLLNDMCFTPVFLTLGTVVSLVLFFITIIVSCCIYFGESDNNYRRSSQGIHKANLRKKKN